VREASFVSRMKLRAYGVWLMANGQESELKLPTPRTDAFNPQTLLFPTRSYKP
jgi:hypothetical protein